MIRHDLKTVRVESKHVSKGVLINADEFNPDAHRLVDSEQIEEKSKKKTNMEVK